MSKEEAFRKLNEIFDKYDLAIFFGNGDYESVSCEPLYNLIEKIYKDFENKSERRENESIS
jgi:hypothetical protein